MTKIRLEEENIEPLSKDLLTKRDKLLSEGKYDDALFHYAHQFAGAYCLDVEGILEKAKEEIK